MIKRVLLFIFFIGFFSFGFSFGEISADAAEKEQLIVINKKTNELAFFENGKLIKVYPVATGKTPSLTPQGTFYIREKIKNRPYYKEGIKGGDPRNPLGDRWLGISYNESGTFPIAIHGNNNEKSIGKYVSAGCIRMHNKDVRELYEKIQFKTKVVITTTNKSLAHIAAPHMKLVAQK
jgi:lipoprotein-anchoring transpeptidase ErfK/SrfK